ncbi:peptidoglycan-associated lipoprotein Pal [Marinobacter changyiensis]|uniref:peptidoglycan-associated lipoprotein Pal n=1 Tax=Marinobacter changyiensis TaxID=2604091 RepID=UPI00126597B8|nr:peptidoglycan-associated lipoprotein Pal [Marinobacter changyiensis]
MMFTMRNKAFALVLSLGFIAGCSSTGDTMEDDGFGIDSSATGQSGGSTVYDGTDGSGVSSSGLTDSERMEAQERASQAEVQALRDITTFYFDFDTAEIKAESRDVLAAHARYLSDNPGTQVRLEGHSDERGTTEYNLALGERRANAVQRFLIVNGASRGQLETVSYGEEKPAVSGSSESAWAQNRRVEMIFQ